MLGAIIGDIVGSVYELNNIKTKDFPLFSERGFFTDDTVMTIAVADALLRGGTFDDCLRGPPRVSLSLSRLPDPLRVCLDQCQVQ